MSVSEVVPHPPKTFLPRPGRPAVRYRAPGPRGPALVDLVEPRTIAVGGPLGDACLFLALATEHLSRVSSSVALAQRQSQHPLMSWVEETDALPMAEAPRPQPPGQASPALAARTTSASAASPSAAAGDERFGALVLYDTPFAGSGLGVRLPAAALDAAARVWLCEVSPEPELFDPLDQLSDSALRDSFTWAQGQHERDVRAEADEVLAERHPTASSGAGSPGRGEASDLRDRPDWDVSGGGFGRIRHHLDLAQAAKARSGT